eukprot:GHVL01013752.1.p1 GENE.GHVL01013752.1~~GHVL01013752.1.p1  ORF type:complete len:239 (-),score=38.76 GHVL01013752.1:277-993(-)
MCRRFLAFLNGTPVSGVTPDFQNKKLIIRLDNNSVVVPFDAVLPRLNQEDLYQLVAYPTLIDAALHGGDVTFLTCGAIGSFKTSYLRGGGGGYSSRGIIPRAFDTVFRGIMESYYKGDGIRREIKLSAVEISRAGVADLFLSYESQRSSHIRQFSKNRIQYLKTKKQEKWPFFWPEGLSPPTIVDVDGIEAACLALVQSNRDRKVRSIAGSNSESSRGHFIFTIIISHETVINKMFQI